MSNCASQLALRIRRLTSIIEDPAASVMATSSPTSRSSPGMVRLPVRSPSITRPGMSGAKVER